MSKAEGLRQAFHYLYQDELPALQELARLLPPNPVVVNIGAGAGTSGLALLESRPDLYLITIDIQKESSPFGCLAGEEEQLKLAGLWGERNRQIHGDSKDVGRRWFSIAYDGRQVDMVFIDGDHSYEGAKGDIEAWLPLIKPGGIMAVHDYRKDILAPTEDGPHPKPWPFVDQAVQECLIDKGYEFVMWVDSLIAFRA